MPIAIKRILTTYLLITALLMMSGSHGPLLAASSEPPVGPSDVLKILLEGNGRFVDGKVEHPNADAERRAKITSGQHPMACILSCSDSRVPPEIVFDRGLGDLFVVRVAGNVPEPAGMESLRYAVDHLGPQLIIVLGHRNCGAVKAAVSGQTEDFPVIDQAILPAVIQTKDMPGDKYENATVENVRMSVRRLSTWKPFADAIKKGNLMIVGGVYNLHDGRVTLITPSDVAKPLSAEKDAED